MTSLYLVLSVVVGVLLAEIGIHSFSCEWFHRGLDLIRRLLPAFQQARDDDARQALLLKSGLAVLRFSIILLLLMMAMSLAAMLAPWALVWSTQQQIMYWVTLSIVAMLWWFVRLIFAHPRTRAQLTVWPMNFNPSYSLLDQCLHWLALEPSVVRHLTFELECQLALPKRYLTKKVESKAPGPTAGSTYVCGLARSGTTMLLRILDEIDVFRTLTYRDMPFVLAPNLWRLITQTDQLTAVAAERAHGDGIQIDFDSPEGFEEVFWRTFGTRKPSRHCLDMEEPTPAVLRAFANYRMLVANSTRQPVLPHGALHRYLSKNNNNLLRLRSLSLDSTATIFVVYRNPFDTARSLHRQHLRFCASQTADPFTRRYMSWLGHHEFGLDHLPFSFALPEMDAALEPTDLNYWLNYWTAIHRHILAQTEVRIHLVNHDAMRDKPEAILTAIFSVLSIDADAASLAQKIAPPVSPPHDTGFKSMLKDRAMAMYQALLLSPKNLRLEAVSLNLTDAI